MEISPWILIVGGIGAMFFGYFFGLFEGRGQGYKKRQAELGTNERSEIQEDEQLPAVPVPPLPPADDPGVLRIKEAGGQLRLELDGAELSSQTLPAEQRRRLIEVITRLRPWLEPPAKVPAEHNTPVPAAAPNLAARAAPPARPAAALPQEQPAPVSSMVSQIDEILQQNIAGTPLAERRVRLFDEPGGGVTVMVGMDRYASIGEVTDPEVQAALRAAIAIWERKYTPGA
jgi:hypothetical protein